MFKICTVCVRKIHVICQIQYFNFKSGSRILKLVIEVIFPLSETKLAVVFLNSFSFIHSKGHCLFVQTKNSFSLCCRYNSLFIIIVRHKQNGASILYLPYVKEGVYSLP